LIRSNFNIDKKIGGLHFSIITNTRELLPSVLRRRICRARAAYWQAWWLWSRMNVVMSTAIDTLLSRSPSTCGGRIRIDGTRVTVHQVVTCYQRGLTPEEIVEQYPHINLAQIYAALAYYHANRDEIDGELEAETSDFLRLVDESKSKS
jgi:uncharacterized protein (DUF433 family)